VGNTPSGTSNTVCWAEAYGNAQNNYLQVNTWCWPGNQAGTNSANVAQATPVAMFAWGAGTIAGWNGTFPAGTANNNYQQPPVIGVTPAQINAAAYLQRPSSPHTGGAVIGLLDGSVRVISPSVTHGTWWTACWPGANVPLGSDW